ncbi:MAG: lysophospholipid acyltransferase family protein [Woeseiaceae bacterium]
MWQAIARFLLRLGGWTVVGGLPDVPKAVLIAAPHTSNWDGYWGIVYKVAVRLNVHWFAKKSLFWFPLGTLLRAFGGIPLDRKRAGSAVDLAIDLFNTTDDSLYFALAPEGTRSKTKYWKTGFYRIAVGADVPVVLGFFDYGRRRLGLGPPLTLSGDLQQDLEALRAFYGDIDGRWPDKTGPIEFPPPRQPRNRNRARSPLKNKWGV